MLTTVQLTPEGPGRTRVTVKWTPYGSAAPEEIATFVHMRSSMTQGWTGSFDKLEAYLAGLSIKIHETRSRSARRTNRTNSRPAK